MVYIYIFIYLFIQLFLNLYDIQSQPIYMQCKKHPVLDSNDSPLQQVREAARATANVSGHCAAGLRGSGHPVSLLPSNCPTPQTPQQMKMSQFILSVP